MYEYTKLDLPCKGVTQEANAEVKSDDMTVGLPHDLSAWAQQFRLATKSGDVCVILESCGEEVVLAICADPRGGDILHMRDAEKMPGGILKIKLSQEIAKKIGMSLGAFTT